MRKVVIRDCNECKNGIPQVVVENKAKGIGVIVFET